MSDHDPNGDDNFRRHFVPQDEDEVPVHHPRKTAAYSFIDPDRIVNVGEKKVEPTQPMEAVDKPLTVRDVISRLIEVNSGAWVSLPQSMKDALIDRPKDFQFVDSFLGSQPTTPKILYNGVLLRFNRSYWEVEKIIR